MIDNASTPGILQDNLNAPMGDILCSIAASVAAAQIELDRSAITVAEMMSGQRLLRDLETGELIDEAGEPTDTPAVVDSRVLFGYTRGESGEVEPTKLSILELGFVPAFYQFAETVIELKIAMRLTKDENRRTVATGAAVDGSYAATYGFEAQYASVLKARLVPVPPPAALDEYLEAKLEEQAALVEEAETSV
ncbi:MAG: hypothetical protein GY856_40750 [bacterium]|nr:hypothetical protein [bacterium]